MTGGVSCLCLHPCTNDTILRKNPTDALLTLIDCVWNVMAHAQKPYFVFRLNGRVHLNRRGRQFSRLLAAEVYTSAVVIMDTLCSEVVWRVLATHSIRQFHLPFPSRASPRVFTFQLDSTTLFIRLHCYMFQPSSCHPQGQMTRFVSRVSQIRVRM